jgi:hypothetical protein
MVLLKIVVLKIFLKFKHVGGQGYERHSIKTEIYHQHDGSVSDCIRLMA